MISAILLLAVCSFDGCWGGDQRRLNNSGVTGGSIAKSPTDPSGRQAIVTLSAGCYARGAELGKTALQGQMVESRDQHWKETCC